jgi:hypothetical protein
MAHFAASQGQSFGRIAIARMDDETNRFNFLDLNIEANRELVLSDIQQLEDSHFTPVN